MTTVWGIVLAGGTGNRYTPGQNKLLEALGNQTVLSRSVAALIQGAQPAGIVLVSHPQWQAAYQQALVSMGEAVPLRWTTGGPTRRASVYHGLLALPEEATIVVIHDAARPLVRPERIAQALIPVRQGKVMGTSLGLPCQNSLKQVHPDGQVIRSLDRQDIWQVHTPQIFQKDPLLQAHQTVPDDPAINDDAELLERTYPGAIRMVEDDPTNLKLTRPADLLVAQALLATPNTSESNPQSPLAP